ncbi:MAG: UvrD-helicase domain-containing protein [bacterium]
MSFLADLHIHSHFSVATSKDCDPEHLVLWACLKGITLVGTGDFTHPGWREELGQKLIPAEEGLYRLKPELEQAVLREIPPPCHRAVRFVLSSEISSIYKKGNRTRKVHNCILVPSLDDACAISERLEQIGNIHSDGRPILGLDSRLLLEIMLEKCPHGIFIPAHVWTPHFSLFGAYSGFDALEECFEDLSCHIHALETGLSSDPAMNWRVSALDRYTLVSNSDAHSPRNLAREANILDCPLSFPALRSALEDKEEGQFLGTVEFFPQEGKYHFNGHRGCGVRMDPEETIRAGGICPVCGKKVTLGVMHRVVELADREAGYRPEGAPPFSSVIPLPEILADYLGCGVGTKRVRQAYFGLIHNLGPEWEILTQTPFEELTRHAGPSLAGGIIRVRSGKVTIRPGFDGEYGTIEVFSPRERESQRGLFAVQTEPGIVNCARNAPEGKEGAIPGRRGRRSSSPPLPHDVPGSEEKSEGESPLSLLNASQRTCVQSPTGPVLVIAGPGTGKTRTLSLRILHLVREKGVSPAGIAAITFTNKAAKEMADRLDALMGHPPSPEARPFIGTFHNLCLHLLRRFGNARHFILFHTYDSLALIGRILEKRDAEKSVKPGECLRAISLIKTADCDGNSATGCDPIILDIYEEYQAGLKRYGALDYDDLIINTVRLLRDDEGTAARIRASYTHILVDEFQDVNPVQYALVILLTGNGAENLFLIGDPNQAIYGFRGADNRLFFRIQEEFPGVQIHSLEENYRSCAPIIESALHVIRRNPQPLPVRLRSIRGEGPLIKLLSLPSERAEGIAVAKEISSLMGGIDMLQAHGETGPSARPATFGTQGGYGFSDFAVLTRTGNQADVLEECLVKEGIPYRVAGNQDILENPLVRQVLALLRWCHNPSDEHSFLQAIDLPVIPLDKREKRAIIDILPRDDGDAAQEGVKKDSSAFRSLINTLTERGMEQAVEALSRYHRMAEGESPAGFVNQVTAGLASHEECSPHARDLRRLGLLAEEFPDVASFLEGVTLCREGDISWRGIGGRRDSEMVNLMTLHAAKGLEFPVVFVCGCEEGLLPYRHRTRPAPLDEERRLFYVGMTRARDCLYLSWCAHRTGRADAGPSSFLTDIPETLSERAVYSPPPSKRPAIRQLGLW